MNLIQEEYKKAGALTGSVIKNIPLSPKMLGTLKGINARPMELTREQDFIDGGLDIFDLLDGQHHDKESLARSLGATIALLKRSSILLQQAEETISIQKQKLDALEENTMVEEVSGLLNRRGFIMTLKSELSRAKRQKADGGLLVMFNLENLSGIRKKLGSDAANQAVKLVAGALKGEIRECDYGARLSDEEFVLLLTDTDMGRALTRLQNMALRLNKLSLIHHGAEMNLNLSLGLKSFNAQERAEDIFKAANLDLQRNRNKGAPTLKSS